MKYEKQIAQCVFPRLNVCQYYADSSYKDYIQELLALDVGGFCVFDGDMEDVKSITDELQFLSEVPLLFCADFEHGLPMRLADGTSFPHHAALARAATRQPEAAYIQSIAAAIATEAKAVGVRWNLAPVCDINSNPRNPVINIRSFGTTESEVSRHLRDYIVGTHSRRVATCAKHFPGHGDTIVDSHAEFPLLTQTWAELEGRELKPFRAAIEADVRAIMLGHIHVGSPQGAAFWADSIAHLRQLSRDWRGLIITDALDMQPVARLKQPPLRHHQPPLTSPELSAFLAGADVLLMPCNPAAVISYINCRLDDYHPIEGLAARVAESATRVRHLKQWVDLLPFHSAVDEPSQLFTAHLGLALRAARAALEVLSPGGASCCPLPEVGYAAFAILQKAEDIQAASRFFTMLAQAVPSDCDYGYIDENITTRELRGLAGNITEAEQLVFALFYKGRGGTGQLANATQINHIINTLADGRPYIVVCFGDPYIAEHIKSDTTILTYSDSFASLAAAVMLLSGRELY